MVNGILEYLDDSVIDRIDFRIDNSSYEGVSDGFIIGVTDDPEESINEGLSEGSYV